MIQEDVKAVLEHGLWQPAHQLAGGSCGQVRFRVNAKPKDMSDHLAEAISFWLERKFGWIRDPRCAQVHVLAQMSRGLLTIGIQLGETPLSKRPYISHLGMRSTVAFVMCREAQLEPGNVCLDPACGFGTTLAEAQTGWPTIVCMGMDKADGSLAKATENDVADLVRVDSALLPLRDDLVDVVISDIPFGRKYGTPEEAEKLMVSLLVNLIRVCKARARVVLLLGESQLKSLPEALCSVKCRGNKRWKCLGAKEVRLGLLSAFIVKLHVVMSSTG